MEFWSFAVEVGAAGIRVVSPEQIAFHDTVARLLAKTDDIVRCGATNCLTISHQEAVHETTVLAERLLSALTGNGGGPRTDLAILDFSGNPFFIIREPLLLILATGIADACASGICRNFAILLPKLPGSNGAFCRKLSHFAELVSLGDYEVRLVGAEGVSQIYARQGERSETLGSPYVAALRTLHGDDQVRLERKCVRRLGHFPAHRTDIRKSKCRHFSYYLHDCAGELTRFFRRWWDESGFGNNPILYDLRGNDLLREVVVAHGTRLDLKVDGVIDVLENADLAKAVASTGTAVLVLDVVDSGMTLRRYVQELSTRGVQVCSSVLTGVNKRSTKDSRFENPQLLLHGLLARPTELVAPVCPQCSIGLPFTSDAGEELVRLRSYDVLFMISQTGWTSEPINEIPYDASHRYAVVPNFSAILDEFGDWIAFKLYNALRDRGLPDDWFVIHPEEGDSSALSRKLYDCVTEELPIVRVPRERIKQAQQVGDDWTTVVAESGGEAWIEQLKNMHPASALVIDIFNGSGMTSRTIFSLLRHFGLMPICYACVVDFSPTRESPVPADVPALALYEWDSPRELNAVTTNA
jgi:hypothetical protein